jgi:hypothetical protein
MAAFPADTNQRLSGHLAKLRTHAVHQASADVGEPVFERNRGLPSPNPVVPRNLAQG